MEPLVNYARCIQCDELHRVNTTLAKVEDCADVFVSPDGLKSFVGFLCFCDQCKELVDTDNYIRVLSMEHVEGRSFVGFLFHANGLLAIRVRHFRKVGHLIVSRNIAHVIAEYFHAAQPLDISDTELKRRRNVLICSPDLFEPLADLITKGQHGIKYNTVGIRFDN